MSAAVCVAHVARKEEPERLRVSLISLVVAWYDVGSVITLCILSSLLM